MRQPKRRVTNTIKDMTPEIFPPMTAPVLMEEEGVGVSKEEVASEEEEADTAIEELVSVEVIVGTAAMIKNRIPFGFTLAQKNYSSCNSFRIIDLF